MARKHDPDDPVIYTPRTWWDWFKGWPLRVLFALLAIFAFAVIVSVVDQFIYPLNRLF